MHLAPVATRFAAAALFVLAAAGCRPDSTASAPESPIILAEDVLPVMMVYKSPTCGCCSKWVDHLRAAGMEVKTTDSDDMGSIKERFGVPGKLSSCHTAVVGGYIIEGHVPFEDIQRLLKERPDAAGLSVPAMPIGSPGMEVEGRPADKYNVLLFDANGNQRVYASH